MISEVEVYVYTVEFAGCHQDLGESGGKRLSTVTFRPSGGSGVETADTLTIHVSEERGREYLSEMDKGTVVAA